MIKKSILIAILCMTKTSCLLADSDISAELADSLLCKTFDEIELNYNPNVVYKNFNEVLGGITRSATLSTEFREKFVEYDKYSERIGSTIVFTTSFPSTFAFVSLSMLEAKSSVNTVYGGDILKFAEDFRKKNPNTNLEYMSQSEIIKYLKDENVFDDLELISLSAQMATDVLSETKDDKTYYSKHFFYAYPKIFNESYRMAVFYTDPLNDKIIHTQCLI